jgi:hypothetical protein
VAFLFFPSAIKARVSTPYHPVRLVIKIRNWCSETKLQYQLTRYFTNSLMFLICEVCALCTYWMPINRRCQVDCVWNVMAHAQKPDFNFRRNGRVYINRRERQFSRLLAAEVCASAVVMLDTPCSEVVWRVLDNHSIRQFPLHFPSRALPSAITFQLDSTTVFPWMDVYIY